MKFKTVILRHVNYVAVLNIIPQDRDLIAEFLGYKDKMAGHPVADNAKYWQHVLGQCVFNLKDIHKELTRAFVTDEQRANIVNQLLGVIVANNPHVYEPERGWV